MNHRKTSLVAISCAILFSLGATIARAQDPSQEPADAKPKPAARSNPVNVDTSDQPDQPANSLQPDNTPLTGITNPTHCATATGFPASLTATTFNPVQ